MFDKPFYKISTRNSKTIRLSKSECDLNCKHCNSHYLKTMKDFKSIDVSQINKYDSVLLSGGFNKDGELDFESQTNYIEFLKNIKTKKNMHTGFLKNKNFNILKIIDAISIDLIADNEAIENVYGLNKSKDDYFDLLQKISDYKKKNRLDLKIVPHITIGLNGGEKSGEIESINYLYNNLDHLEIDKIVFIIFIPTKNTYFEYKNPPSLDFVKDILKYSVKKFENRIKIFLGCMRPAGKYRKSVDQIASVVGIDGIVNTVLKDDELLLRYNAIINKSSCCSLL